MKYIVALAACAGVIIFWAVVGATVFNWQHGGGFLWQIFIWGTVVAVWVAVTSAWRNKSVPPNSSSGRQDRSPIVKAPDVFDSIREHDKPSARDTTSAESDDISIDDSQFYAQAMTECMQNQAARDAGLWAKAFSLANGNDTATQAKYIELRAADLLRKERARIQAQQREARAAEEARRSEIVPFPCPLCGKEKRKVTRGMIEDRQSSARPNWTFQCIDCQKRFDLRDALPHLRDCREAQAKPAASKESS